MAFRRILSLLLRASLIVGGTVLLTLGIVWGHVWLMAGGVVLYAVLGYMNLVVRRRMREKCWLMLEAVRNKDYTFRLPVGNLSENERILQDTVNRFGVLMGEQKKQMEQRERFYELILSNVTSGIIVLDDDNRILQSNPAAARLLGLPTVSSLQQLGHFNPRLPEKLGRLSAGDRCDIRFSTNSREVALSVRTSAIQLDGKRVRVLSLNDIRNELDAKELASWIKLTRVLTHEIMNSIAPIVSLSETFMKRDDVVGSPLYKGIEAIHDTSVGLTNFVDTYRKFSALQQPVPEPFYLNELVSQIRELHVVPSHIRLTLQIEPEDLMLYADRNLIRQVLINLLKNAGQAIGDKEGRIHIHAYTTMDEHIFIKVSNDGEVIPDDVAEEIFVPFFTTRPDGSGIGLSLARQIMQLSGGSISLLRAGTNGWNTTFVLEFE